MPTFAGVAAFGSVAFAAVGVIVLALISVFRRRDDQPSDPADDESEDLLESAAPRRRVPPAYGIALGCFAVAAVLGVIGVVQRSASVDRLLERIAALERRLDVAEVELETRAVVPAVLAATEGRAGAPDKTAATVKTPVTDKAPRSEPAVAAPKISTRQMPPAARAPAKAEPLRPSTQVPPTVRAERLDAPSRVAPAPAAERAVTPSVAERTAAPDPISASESAIVAAPPSPNPPSATAPPLSAPHAPAVAAPSASATHPRAVSASSASVAHPPTVSAPLPSVAAASPAERDVRRAQAPSGASPATSRSSQPSLGEKVRSDWEAVKRAAREGGDDWVAGWRRLRGLFVP